MTKGGVDHVLECVGASSSMNLAIRVARPGGTIGYVGVPHGPAKDGLDVMAPVRAYMDELMEDVLAGTLDPSPVFDMTDQRRALKVLVEI